MPIVEETPRGQLRLEGNETITDAKDADPSKFRVGSRYVPGKCGGGGGYSFDIIEEIQENNRRTEAAVINGGFNGTGGEIGISVWDGTQPISDASQRKVMEIRHNEVEFKVPVKGIGSGDRVTRFYTDGGRFCINWQDDTGRPDGVVYATQGSTDESVWKAVGRVRIDMF